ncbi:MAG TPA: phosphatidate cytidylyltransferase [Gemmatimonadaceae bacterium]|nr:phosphatidate cytidylyltransferase [Gemmatimonadaceae bacterium]
MSELATRVVTALLLAPVALGVIYLGGLPLATFLAAIAVGCAWEFFRLARHSGVEPLDPIGMPLAGAIPLAVYAATVGAYRTSLSVPAVAMLVILGTVIWARGTGGRPLGSAAATVLGVLYSGGLLSFGYALREHPYAVGDRAGTALVAFPLVLTWASDIGAFFVGRAVGGRKLITAVSPGKTVSGALGGLAVTVIVAWVYVRFALAPAALLTMSTAGALAFGAVISIAAQIGDLAESLLKREANVKDSSRLIPGHGGLLDRLDSLLFVLPVAYLLFDWLLVPAAPVHAP